MITYEQKKEIAALYADKSNKVVDIAAAYKITNGRCKQIALEMGCKPRQKTHVFKEAKIKKCPKCKAKIAVNGARFCPYCGADIRSERGILADKLTQVWRTAEVVGHNITLYGDEARDVVLEVIAYLKKEG